MVKKLGSAKKVVAKVKQGLAGVKSASGPGCTVDTGVSKQNAKLAKSARVIPGIHARLALIDAVKNMDKYYVLQGLEDPKGKGNRFFAYSRWGRTGTSGQCALQGPMDESKAKMEVAKIFKSKTGATWGTLKPGERAKPGKYWLMAASKADPKAKWEYYVSDHVDGKKTGWYPYDKAASAQVEELHAQHDANKGGKNNTSVRVIESGVWMYKVDLLKMEQQNTKTRKKRKIRRSAKS